MTLVQAVPLAGAVIVTTPQSVALLDSRKGLNMFRQLGVPILGIVENMSYFVPPDLPDRQYDIFGSEGERPRPASLVSRCWGGSRWKSPCAKGEIWVRLLSSANLSRLQPGP